MKTTGRFLFCCDVVNPGAGRLQVGVGDGVGVGVGDAEPVGEGVGDGVGVGEPPPEGPGMLTMSAVAADANVTFWPPVNTASSGVRRLKWPVTVTVTRFAGVDPVAHDGVHATVTSAGTIVTKELVDSLVTAHMILFDAALQADPDENDVGS